jgi:FAD/FMN-containing dehydrogenase
MKGGDLQKDLRERKIIKVPVKHEIDGSHNQPENLEKACRELREALGEEWVSNDINITVAYARDQSVVPMNHPHIVALPGSTEDVAAIMKVANKHLVDVTPYGTGLNTLGMTIPPYGGILCDMRRMDEIIEIDEENMLCTIGPGVTFAQLQTETLKRNLRLINPSTSANASVVSNIMMGNISTLANKYGVGLDHIIGYKIVLPEGQVMVGGPAAYGADAAHMPGPGPDVRAFIRGSMGTLGIITEMTLRLYPNPDYVKLTVPVSDTESWEHIAPALKAISQRNIVIENAYFQNTYMGIFLAETNLESSKLIPVFPRHYVVPVTGGFSEEETEAKCKVCEEDILAVAPEFEFMDWEVVEDISAGRILGVDKFTKFFRESVRVQRVKGSFFVGFGLDHLDNLVEINKAMMRAMTSQVGTDDNVFSADMIASYFQPYDMGRLGFIEFDIFIDQSNPEDSLRTIAGTLAAMAASFRLGSGVCFGVWALVEGAGPLHDLIGFIFPQAATYVDTYRDMKMIYDPNNICMRRFDYDTLRMKKAAL